MQQCLWVSVSQFVGKMQDNYIKWNILKENTFPTSLLIWSYLHLLPIEFLIRKNHFITSESNFVNFILVVSCDRSFTNPILQMKPLWNTVLFRTKKCKKTPRKLNAIYGCFSSRCKKARLRQFRVCLGTETNN